MASTAINPKPYNVPPISKCAASDVELVAVGLPPAVGLPDELPLSLPVALVLTGPTTSPVTLLVDVAEVVPAAEDEVTAVPLGATSSTTPPNTPYEGPSFLGAEAERFA